MKKLLSLILLLTIHNSLFSQSAEDALRLSESPLLGTSRSVGTNTGMGSIGGDFSSTSFNPAGLAQYSFSEFVLTPGIQFVKTISLLIGNNLNQNTEDKKTRFIMPNMGLVFASPRAEGQENKFVFGLGYNSYQTSSRDFNFQGKSKGSISERFAALANGLAPNELDNYEAGLAYDTYVLIDQNPDKSWNYDYQGYEGVELSKEQIVSSRSRQSEFNISGAVKSGKMFMAGATIGIPVTNYTEEKNYYESDPTDAVPYFEKIRFGEVKTSKGVGINAKAGVIIRPINALSIGLAIHSPSLVAIKEDFSTRLAYSYLSTTGVATLDTLSPEGTIDYTVFTPMKLIGSLGSIIGKHAFINADVTWVNYTSSRIKIKSSNAYDKESERITNREIKDNYKSAIQINLGGEYAFNNGFRIRGGYGMAQSSLKGDDKFYPSFAVGAGYRKNKFFLDLGYRNVQSSRTYEPYIISGNVNQTLVTQDFVNTAITATLGFKLY